MKAVNLVLLKVVFSLHVPLLLKKSVQPFHLHLFGQQIGSNDTFQNRQFLAHKSFLSLFTVVVDMYDKNGLKVCVK